MIFSFNDQVPFNHYFDKMDIFLNNITYNSFGKYILNYYTILINEHYIESWIFIFILVNYCFFSLVININKVYMHKMQYWEKNLYLFLKDFIF
jgi:hypothetical protein